MINNSKIKQLLEKAWVSRREGKYNEARNIIKEAHELCDDDDYNSLGRIYHIYMQFESDHNRPIKALNLCKQSLGYYKKTNNLDKIAHSTRHIADLERHLGYEIDSERNYREAIHLYNSNPNTTKGDLANTLRGFGLLLEKRKKIEEAITTWKKVKKLYLDCNLQAGVEEANQKLNSLL